jgi:hypothetical protein
VDSFQPFNIDIITAKTSGLGSLLTFCRNGFAVGCEAVGYAPLKLLILSGFAPGAGSALYANLKSE